MCGLCFFLVLCAAILLESFSGCPESEAIGLLLSIKLSSFNFGLALARL